MNKENSGPPGPTGSLTFPRRSRRFSQAPRKLGEMPNFDSIHEKTLNAQESLSAWSQRRRQRESSFLEGTPLAIKRLASTPTTAPRAVKKRKSTGPPQVALETPRPRKRSRGMPAVPTSCPPRAASPTEQQQQQQPCHEAPASDLATPLAAGRRQTRSLTRTGLRLSGPLESETELRRQSRHRRSASSPAVSVPSGEIAFPEFVLPGDNEFQVGVALDNAAPAPMAPSSASPAMPVACPPRPPQQRMFVRARRSQQRGQLPPISSALPATPSLPSIAPKEKKFDEPKAVLPASASSAAPRRSRKRKREPAAVEDEAEDTTEVPPPTQQRQPRGLSFSSRLMQPTKSSLGKVRTKTRPARPSQKRRRLAQW